MLLVLLGLSTAFSIIDHCMPLLRLSDEVGAIGTAHQWFKSYLEKRFQHVTVNQVSSYSTDLWCATRVCPRSNSVVYVYYIAGAGVACWLERRTRDRKVTSSNPGRSSGRIFFSRVNFVC